MRYAKLAPVSLGVTSRFVEQCSPCSRKNKTPEMADADILYISGTEITISRARQCWKNDGVYIGRFAVALTA